jgi:hypothetical protein
MIFCTFTSLKKFRAQLCAWLPELEGQMIKAKHHIMKTYEGVEVNLHALFTLILYGGK